MNEWDVLLLVGTGIVAGMANTLAGGGSLLAVPMLIFLGYPATTANATIRPAILAQNIFACMGFGRGGAYGDARVGVVHILCAVPGALFGAYLAATWVDDETFKRLLAVIMIGVLALTWLRRRGGRQTGTPRIPPAATLLLFVGIGFYGGFVQAGVGFLLMALWMNTTTWNLARINAWKVALVGVYTLGALLIFSLEGTIAWGPALALVVGQAAGGWLGSRLTLRVGDVVLMRIYATLLVVFAVILLWPRGGAG